MNANLMPLNPIPVDRFTFVKESNMLIGEMSEVAPHIGHIYKDAMDKGFLVKGKTMDVRYYFASVLGGNEEYDGEEVLVFKPISSDVRRAGRRLPEVHVLND